MSKEEIDEFARLLVMSVRDMAIKSCDVQLHGNNMKAPTIKRWHDIKNGGDINKFAEMIISDAVDEALFYLFLAIDEGSLNISFNNAAGKNVDVDGDIIGELAGWYMGEWRSKYSDERFFDDIT
jgi:hypothetical protein